MESESRQKILDATRLLLREKPVSEFRLREVSERAGLSHQTIYNVVGNTDRVLAAVLNDYVAQAGEEIAPMLPEAQHKDPVGAIVSFTQVMTNVALRDPLPLKGVLQDLGPSNLSENKTSGLDALCATLLEASGIPSQSAQEAGRMINYGWRGVLLSWAHGLIHDEDLQTEATMVARAIADVVTTRHDPPN